MTNCKSCGKRVSNTKKTCRYCGAKVRKRTSIGRIIATVIVFFGFLIFVVPFILNTFRGQGLLGPSAIVNTTIEVPAGEYYYSSFKLKQPMDVQLTVQRNVGPAVDIYFFDEAAYQEFQNVSSTTYISGGTPTVGFNTNLSVEGLTDQFESNKVKLGTGPYHLIVDNSAYGATNPDKQGKAFVKIKLTGQ